MHFKKSVLKNHLLYSIITLMGYFLLRHLHKLMYKHGILLILANI